MPCEWEGKNIRVMHEVVVVPPYRLENCQSTNEQTLARIRKVVSRSFDGKTLYD